MNREDNARLSKSKRQCWILVASVALALATTLAASPALPAASRHAHSRGVHAAGCIPIESLEAWQPIDDHSLLIWPPNATGAYLLTLRHPIHGLRESKHIAVLDSGTKGFICAGGRDGIVMHDEPGTSVPITSIEHLSLAQTAAMLRTTATLLRI